MPDILLDEQWWVFYSVWWRQEMPGILLGGQLWVFYWVLWGQAMPSLLYDGWDQSVLGILLSSMVPWK